MAANQYMFLWAMLWFSVVNTLMAVGENTTEVPGVAYAQIIGSTLENVTNCNLPNDVNASVTIGGDVIELHLHNNDRVHSNSRTFLMKNGRSILEPYTALEEKNYRLYHDNNNTASIMLKCPKRGRKSFEIRGTFMYRGSLVRLTLATSKRGDRPLDQNVDRDEYSVVRQKQRSFDTADFAQPRHRKGPYKAKPNPVNCTTNMEPVVRKRRQGTEIHIDLVAVVDNAIYEEWYNRSSPSTTKTREAATIDDLRQYFALVINEVDMLYQGITTLPYGINIHLVGYVIAQTSFDAYWTEEARIFTNSTNRINSTKALESFGKWVAQSSSFPNYDHAILFTGLDLYGPYNGADLSDLWGHFRFDTMCDLNGRSVSLVEHDGAFEIVWTAARGIGASLGSRFDGDPNNTCSSSSNYIMARVRTFPTDSRALNAWKFSTCSVSYFRGFIDYQLLTRRGRDCLVNSLTPVNVADVTGLVPGQLYDPDEQCRHVYGPTSSFCRGTDIGDISNVCLTMYCSDPKNSTHCFRYLPARGTSCGNQRWCVAGQCVCDPKAPSKDAQCVFGDQPGIIWDNKSCKILVRESSSYCYQDFVFRTCCQSCGSRFGSRLPVADCGYPTGLPVMSSPTTGLPVMSSPTTGLPVMSSPRSANLTAAVRSGSIALVASTIILVMALLAGVLFHIP